MLLVATLCKTLSNKWIALLPLCTLLKSDYWFCTWRHRPWCVNGALSKKADQFKPLPTRRFEYASICRHTIITWGMAWLTRATKLQWPTLCRLARHDSWCASRTWDYFDASEIGRSGHHCGHRWCGTIQTRGKDWLTGILAKHILSNVL